MNEDLLIASVGIIFIGAVALFINAPTIVSTFFILLGISIAVISLFENKQSYKTIKPREIKTKKEPKKEKSLSDRILEIIDKNNGILQTELIEKLDVSRSEAYKILEELEREGKIRREKHGRTYRLFINK